MTIAEHIAVNIVMPDPAYASHWDAIVVPPERKERLLHHALLAWGVRGKISFETSAVHGLAVLLGPPGTGKTTLARGLAYTASQVLQARRCRLVEIHPHGLMSAEHGQTQQAVSELLLEHLPELTEDGTPTIVLLDEVESMAVARSAASLSANPVDVHRATDAVLTALDDLTRRAPHLFFVVTSNYPRVSMRRFSRAPTSCWTSGSPTPSPAANPHRHAARLGRGVSRDRTSRRRRVARDDRAGPARRRRPTGPQARAAGHRRTPRMRAGARDTHRSRPARRRQRPRAHAEGSAGPPCALEPSRAHRSAPHRPLGPSSSGWCSKHSRPPTPSTTPTWRTPWPRSPASGRRSSPRAFSTTAPWCCGRCRCSSRSPSASATPR